MFKPLLTAVEGCGVEDEKSKDRKRVGGWVARASKEEEAFHSGGGEGGGGMMVRSCREEL